MHAFITTFIQSVQQHDEQWFLFWAFNFSGCRTNDKKFLYKNDDVDYNSRSIIYYPLKLQCCSKYKSASTTYCNSFPQENHSRVCCLQADELERLFYPCTCLNPRSQYEYVCWLVCICIIMSNGDFILITH